jgi:hypothetical protein
LPDWFRSLVADTIKEGRLSDEEKAELADLQNGLDAAFMRFDLMVDDPDLVNDIGIAIINAALMTSYAGDLSLAKMREAAKEFRRNGGKARAKQKAHQQWKLWRGKALIECKKKLREKPNIKQAALVRHLRKKQDPPCTDPTLEDAIAKWKRKLVSLLPRIQKRKTSPSSLLDSVL